EWLPRPFSAVAVESMAHAIRHVWTRQGLDPADFTLFCFGGAAGQHACSVASAAGIQRILIHPLASVLSAYGVGVADRLCVRRASLRARLDESALSRAEARLAELESDARGELAAFGDGGSVSVTRLLELRSGDSETLLAVEFQPLPGALREFSELHVARFGFEAPEAAPVIEAVRIEARSAPRLAASLRMPADEA